VPEYVPNALELQVLYDLLAANHLLDLPGDRVIAHVNTLVAGGLPAGIATAVLPPPLAANPKSTTLAVAHCMLRPSRLWAAAAAVQEFQLMRGPLLAAWAALHGEHQKRRKIVDQAVLFGAQNLWPTAVEVVISWILGDPYRIMGWPPRIPPLAAPLDRGALEIAADFLEGPPRNPGGLIPRLSACWGGDFKDSLSFVAGKIWSWLRTPLMELPFEPGHTLAFTPETVGVGLGPLFADVPPGSRRNFRLLSGGAALTGPNGFNQPIPPGQRLMLRALDEGEAAIQVAHFVPHGGGGAIAGPILTVVAGGLPGLLSFSHRSVLEAWSCTCGTWSCDKRHRLEGWDPGAVPANASLRTFLQTAVKGPGQGFGGFGKYVTSMLYAALCDDS
jgi:hypothetical protein